MSIGIAIGSVNIMVLVCHMIFPDHVIKGSCDFLGRNPSRQFTILQGLVVTDTMVVEDIKVFVCHKYLQDLVTKG